MTSEQTRGPRRVLCVWAPDWPVQRLRREGGAARGGALALSVGDGRTERVAACSAEARRIGVRAGMRTPDAQALAGPGRLTVSPHRPGDDRRALERLAACCDRFSPLVALEDAAEPEAILLEVTGLAPLWGENERDGEARLARAVAAWLVEERLEGRVAVASTVGLALAAARFVCPPPIVPPAETRAAAAALPIAALRVDDATADTLVELGVDTVGRLLGLPRASLPARFGFGLSRRLDQLLGDAPEPVESLAVEPPLETVWEFETAVADGGVLERTLGRLLERLEAAMLCRRRGALRVLVTYEADAADRPAERVALRLFRPTTSARELAELAALHAAGLRFCGAVKAVRVLVGSTAPIERRQRRLFDEDPRDDPHELALLVNRLASRVGAERVSRIERRRSHDPRRAYAYRPATDACAKAFGLTPREAGRARRAPLAMATEEGEPITVDADRDGAPTTVRWRGLRRVARCWGPERVETGWWRGRGLRRDAYWVELEDGGRLWLCVDLRRRRWFLAGEFC